MDKVFIENLTVETVIGIYDWEREIRQSVSLDLEMDFDIAAAAASATEPEPTKSGKSHVFRDGAWHEVNESETVDVGGYRVGRFEVTIARTATEESVVSRLPLY